MRTGTQIAELIEEYLVSKNISRRKFCSLINIPSSTIGNWKLRNSYPTVELASKIATFMDVSLDWLINGENNGSVQIPVNDYKKLIIMNELFPEFMDLTYEQKQTMKNLIKDFSELSDSAQKLILDLVQEMGNK